MEDKGGDGLAKCIFPFVNTHNFIFTSALTKFQGLHSNAGLFKDQWELITTP